MTMTTVATDDLNRTNEDPLSGGGNWVSGPGAFSDLQLVSNSVRSSDQTVDVGAIWTADGAQPTAQYSFAQISALTSSNGSWPGVCINVQGAADGSCYAFQVKSSTNEGHIFRVDDTGSLAFTDLVTVFTYAEAVGHYMMIENDGSGNIKAYVDSGSGFVQVGATATDTNHTGGYFGFALYGNPESYVQMDNWEGGIVTTVTDLVIQDAAHAHSADNVVLESGVDLVIQEANHALSSDNIGLTQLHILSIDEANHALSSSNLVLTQLHILLINEANHSHSAENVTITQAQILAIQESNHAHSSENLVLTQLHILQIQDATHAHTAEYLTLTQDQLLSIQDALHALTSDNVGITSGLEFEIQESAHALTSDNVTLTQAQLLAIQEATHALTSDNAVLSQGHILVISEALHAMIADNVVLSVPSDGAPTTPLDRIFVVKYENRVYAILK